MNDEVTREICQLDGKSYKRQTSYRLDGMKLVHYYVDRKNTGNWAYLPEWKYRIIVHRINKALA